MTEARQRHSTASHHARWRSGRVRPWAAVALLALSVVATLVALVAYHDRPLSAPVPAEAASWELPAATPPAALSFSTLLTAQSRGSAEGVVVAGGRWWVHRRPVQFAVLVRHPQGNFLFDTGLGQQHATQFQANHWLHQQLFAYTMHQDVKTQLASHGMANLPLRWIIPSHMHWDHIGGLPDFPDVPVWTVSAERQHASDGAPPAFLHSQFADVKQWVDLTFDGPPVLGFPNSHDVFGDGSVLLLPLQGHTAGQVGMLLTLPSGQRHLFTGDTTWTLEGIQQPADRSWLLRQILRLDHDVPTNQAAIVHLHVLAQRFPALHMVPAHDENVLEALPRFPAFAN